jgi:type I restriction enzyme S subunit
MIPWIDEADEAGKRLEQAQGAYIFSERLTQGAKQMVEGLIEGKISEEEIKQAQEGLEQGDNSLDRAILLRLTRKGIDEAKEPPLFADLDALYDAIAQSNL